MCLRAMSDLLASGCEKCWSVTEGHTYLSEQLANTPVSMVYPNVVVLPADWLLDEWLLEDLPTNSDGVSVLSKFDARTRHFMVKLDAVHTLQSIRKSLGEVWPAVSRNFNTPWCWYTYCIQYSSNHPSIEEGFLHLDVVDTGRFE
jgi:hypothetical protein